MATVYVGNKTHGAVKITDHNGRYSVYRLHEVQVPLSSSSNLKRPKWVWESEPFETWTYKPYEANDVTIMPDTLLPFVKSSGRSSDDHLGVLPVYVHRRDHADTVRRRLREVYGVKLCGN